jgi:hypothetical protein
LKKHGYLAPFCNWCAPSLQNPCKINYLHILLLIAITYVKPDNWILPGCEKIFTIFKKKNSQAAVFETVL